MLALARLAYIVAWRRIVSNWRLELILFLGMLLAVALMASGVIFSNLLSEAALRHALSEATPEQANFWVRVFSGQDAPPTAEGRAAHYRSNLNFAEGRVTAPISDYLRDQSRLLETSTFFFTGHPQLELDNQIRPRGEIKFMSGLLPDRIEIVQGRWPYDDPSGGSPVPGQPLEVAVDTLGAELLQLKAGDRMGAFPAASFVDPPSIPVEIVGVFRKTDPGDEFWYGTKRTFSFKNDQWTIIPLFTAETAILRQVYHLYPTLYTDVTWFHYLDRPALRAGQVDGILNTIRSIKYDVRTNLKNSSNGIRLDRVLEDYKEQLLLARIPLFLILFLVTGILTYYLALTAGLVVKSRTAEIAMLKSRGATTSQVGLMALVEGVLLAIPAAVLGPLLAMGVVRVLGRVFFGLGGSGDLASVPVVLSTQAFLLGLAGAMLAVAVLTVSTLIAARHGMVEFQQMGARPPSAPFIHRYYLDFLLLGLIGLLWWQVQSRGSFLVRPLGSRGLEIDYSLLLGPMLGLLAMGLLVMRVLPMVAGLFARAAEPVAPAWLVHGLRHISRDPVVPGALVVLLMFSTALGVIGSVFSSTLERSQKDRALYAAGADLRIEHVGNSSPLPLQGHSELVKNRELADGAAEVQRSHGHLTTTGFSTSGTLLAVEAEEFDKVAWYRPDFSGGKSLEQLTKLLIPEASSQPQGIVLPKNATKLAVSVQPNRPDSRLSLQARLQDARGYYFDVFIGQLDSRGWQRFEAELVPLLSSGQRSADRTRLTQVVPPFTLLSIQLSARSGSNEPGALFLGELAALGPNGEKLLDDFRNLDGWHVIEDYTRPGLYALEASKSVSLPGSPTSARFSWAPGSFGLRGIRPGSPEKPIPALVSKKFLEVANAEVGDVRTIGMSTFSVPVVVVALVDYFPTLDPEKKPFAVVDLKTFIHHANLHSPRPFGGSNELWVSLSNPGSDPAAVAAALDGTGARIRNSYLASEMVLRRVEQPLVNAGWGALLVLMFMALVLASASGVMLFSFIDTMERQTEFALLRTLGSSRTQLNGAVWFSVLLVAACGIALGTLAGLLTGITLLPLMEVAEEGAKVTPRMVLQTNWITLGVSYLVLAGVTLGTVLWLVWFTAKMQVHQVLRIGEG